MLKNIAVISLATASVIASAEDLYSLDPKFVESVEKNEIPEFTFTPMLGYVSMGQSEDKQVNVFVPPTGDGVGMKDHMYESFALGVKLTQRIELEAEYGQVQTTAQSPKGEQSAVFDARQQNFNANLLVKNDALGLETPKLKTYGLVGVGHTIIEEKANIVGDRHTKMSSEDTLVNLGYGFEYRLNRYLSVRGEGRVAYNTDQRWYQPMALLGVQGHFGKQKPNIIPKDMIYVPKEQIVEAIDVEVDADKDGVADSKDNCPNTSIRDAVNQYGCTITVNEPIRLQLAVQFDSNQSVIKSKYEAEITQVASYLNNNPKSKVAIEGHTDSSGNEAKNVLLSQARADAVMGLLVINGNVNPNRIKSRGYGSSQSVTYNSSAAGRRLNRRTMVVVTGESTKSLTR